MPRAVREPHARPLFLACLDGMQKNNTKARGPPAPDHAEKQQHHRNAGNRRPRPRRPLRLRRHASHPKRKLVLISTGRRGGCQENDGRGRGLRHPRCAHAGRIRSGPHPELHPDAARHGGGRRRRRPPNKDRPILVYCRSGNRSKQASQTLADLGYTNAVEFGGINSWPYDVER